MDEAHREGIYSGYRLINVVGAGLLLTMAALLLFVTLYLDSADGWPAAPLGVGWGDALAFGLAGAVPPVMRWGVDRGLRRTARRGKGENLAVAVQLVSWAAVGVWTSCQVPLLVGFGDAFLRERTLLLVPFYAACAAGAVFAVPRFRVWREWFGLLANPSKRTSIPFTQTP